MRRRFTAEQLAEAASKVTGPGLDGTHVVTLPAGGGAHKPPALAHLRVTPARGWAMEMDRCASCGADAEMLGEDEEDEEGDE